jgi:hypothetical protein
MRRYFQFRLRTALVVMLLSSLGSGWVGANYRQWQTEQTALAAIGSVSVEDAYLNPFR